MSPDDLLAHLSERSVTLFVRDDKLIAVPAGSLTDELRAAIREHRAELKELLAPGCFLAAVENVFGDVIVREEEERIEDHLSATVIQSCWGRLAACKRFTAEQMAGFTASQVAARLGEGCGDCDLFHARLTLQHRQEKREKTEARERARERANAWALEHEHAEEDEE